LYRAGSLVAVSNELSKYKLDLVGVQEIRWEGGGTELTGEYTFFYGMGNENHELGTECFVHKRIISAVKMVQFINDRMSYITLTSLFWKFVSQQKIKLNVKDGFYEEFERLFDNFPKYHTKILLEISMPK
jgi:hypothetical protein